MQSGRSAEAGMYTAYMRISSIAQRSNRNRAISFFEVSITDRRASIKHLYPFFRRCENIRDEHRDGWPVGAKLLQRNLFLD